MAISQDGTYYDDGGFPFDGQVFTYKGKSFILEGFDPVEGSKFIESDGPSGAPRGGRDIVTVIMGSGLCQYPSGATDADAPTRFTEITLKHRGEDKVFIVIEITLSQKSGTERKCPIKLRERLTNQAQGS